MKHALVLFLLLQSLGAAGQRAKSPDKIPGATRVDAEQVIGLVNAISSLIIIDARIRADRKQGYLEGSKSLPDVETSCRSLAKLIPNKQTPSLFYCNGVECGRSAVSVSIALSCGYKHVYWFRGGFVEWKAKGYPFLKE